MPLRSKRGLPLCYNAANRMKPSIPQPPRYSSRPFPPYRHRPGRTPHPVLDPAGHLYGQKEQPGEPFDPEKWRQSEDYLYGVDLFNHSYYWEAHEAWEGLWKSAPQGSLSNLFLRGMIQLAAALLQREMGKLYGMQSLSDKGLKKLRRVARQHRTFCGVELKGWIDSFEEWLNTGDGVGLTARRLLSITLCSRTTRAAPGTDANGEA